MKIPGFVDLQVNGYKGIDFSSLDLTADSFCFACEELLKNGTAAFLPTIITSSKEVYIKNLPIIAKVIKSRYFKDSVLGIHLEGPFISDRPGAVGAHPKNCVKRPSVDLLNELNDLSKNNIKILTIAAELSGAMELMSSAISKGIVVSLGHQMAGYTEMLKMHEAGVKAITHLGNGMPNEVPRHNNQILSALAIKDFKAMIITDGHHLPEHIIRAVFNAKDVENIIVTSDASPIAGMKPGRYNVLGNDAILEPNGLLHNPEKKCLVGSSATMLECMNYLASLKILSMQNLLNVGFYNPLHLINIEPYRISNDFTVEWNEDLNKFELINN